MSITANARIGVQHLVHGRVRLLVSAVGVLLLFSSLAAAQSILPVQDWVGTLDIVSNQNGSGSSVYQGLINVQENFQQQTSARLVVTLSKDPANALRWIGPARGPVTVHKQNTLTITPVGSPVTCSGTLFWIGSQPQFSAQMTLETDASGATYRLWLTPNTIPAPDSGSVVCPFSSLTFPTVDPMSPFAPRLETAFPPQPVGAMAGNLGGIVALSGHSGMGGFVAGAAQMIYTVTWDLDAVGGGTPRIPAVNSGGILNSASNAVGQPVTPGALVAIYGSQLAAGLAQANSIPLSTSLGDVTVSFNGKSAPLLFVAAGQINAQLPWDVLGGASAGDATVVVRRGENQSQPVSFPVGPFSPGIFTLQYGIGQAVAFAVDGRLAAPVGSVPGLNTAPAAPGSALILLGTGLGSVDPPPPPNGASSLDALRTCTTTPVVLIGGKRAQVLFAGLSPQFVGVYQANVLIPADVTPGNAVPIQIDVGGITTTAEATIAVLSSVVSVAY